MGFFLKETLRSEEIGFFQGSQKRVGSLMTGYAEIDQRIGLRVGDLVTVQSMSGHGKTTFLLQLAYRFLSLEKNQKINPKCFFLSLSCDSLALEKKFLNVVSRECGEGLILDPNSPTCKKDFPKTGAFYNLVIGKKIWFLNMSSTAIGKVKGVLNGVKEGHVMGKKTPVVFLDCFQQLTLGRRGQIWERNEGICKQLSLLAKKKKIIIFVASQVNYRRQIREGKELLYASDFVFDIFNHSDCSISPNSCWGNAQSKRLYTKPIKKKSVVSISVLKAKRSATFYSYKDFLFDGFVFEDTGHCHSPQTLNLA